MRYFTPDLIAKGQSKDDDVLDRQERLWEEANERYRSYLEQARPYFPKGLKRLTSHYYLHDARVLSMAQRGHHLILLLQLDTPPHPLLELRYRLLWGLEVGLDALPPICRGKGPAMCWLYSEITKLSNEQVVTRSHDWVNRKWFDLVQRSSPAAAPARAEGEPPNGSAEWPFWQHSILLSNGWELTLAFRDVEAEEMTPIVVPYSPYQAPQSTWTIHSSGRRPAQGA
jgi:hypothetical protein